MKKNWKTLSIILSIVVGIGVMVFAFPADVVHAAPVDPPDTEMAQDGEPGRWRDRVLERLYGTAQSRFAREQRELDRANNAIPRFEDRIQSLKDEGMETGVIEDGLSTLKAELILSQEALEPAAVLLDEHPGFDEYGKVVDAEKAKAMLQDAGKSIRETHTTLHTAVREFREIVQEFREENDLDQK